ncbi:MAG TPA: DNA polymerase [Cytophagaceae bacterium]
MRGELMLIFDIETDGLLEQVTKIHTMTIYDTDTDRYDTYDLQSVYEGVKRLSEAKVICGHNIIFFDVPVLKKLYPHLKFDAKRIDTLVWARLAYPDIRDIDFKYYRKWQMPGNLIGRHSLEAWGYRVGEYKGEFCKTTDWQEWSKEMSDYCRQDVVVTVKLYNTLRKKEIPKEALQLEHEVAEIISLQIQHGFLFDIEKAEKLYQKLLGRKEELIQQLQEMFPPWYVELKPFIPKRNNKKKGYIAGVPVKRKKLVEFNPSSRQHIAYQLKKKYGWEPKEFTEKGTPKIDDEVIGSLPYEEAPLLAEYLMIEKRLGQLAEGDKAWLKLVGKDNRIHGDVITCGAVTGRMTHKDPNVAQVPAVGVPYGYECRELFCVRPGYKLVGADASGLELRCLAHYMARYDGGAYGKQVVEGDIHTVNQQAAGLPTRQDAKRFIYAFLYGAGDEKIGAITGGGKKEGNQLRKKFLKRIPALKSLINDVQKVSKERGYLKGLDGRHLKVRAIYSALNTLLQSAGAIVMKKALVILYNDLTAKGYQHGKEYAFCANIHDEFEIEVREDLAEEVGQMAVNAIRKAGDYFGFRCPLDGEYKVGNNWAETH